MTDRQEGQGSALDPQGATRPLDPSTFNLLTDVPGVMVGHTTDLALGSGVTAILFDAPAAASVTVPGGAPGGHETGLLETDMTVAGIDAIVLAGGSSFGLEAASGVKAALREAGRGLKVGSALVPIVSGAILFDLLGSGDKTWGRFPPYRDLGYAAATSATAGAFALGSVGAGTGATTVTLKGGLGSASALTAAGHTVGALAAVNAVGTATIADGPWFWAAPFELAAEFGGLGWPARMPPGALTPPIKRACPTATTLAVVATDAVLTKPQARRLAIMANAGLARAIHPGHAPMDGDTVFAAATLRRPLRDPVYDLADIGHVAALTLARAIARAVYEATALPHPRAMPAWRDRFPDALAPAPPPA